MLEKLLRHAPATSAHAIFAKRQLAELTVQRAPWRAARLARDVLEVLPEDDRAWAVLGLAHTLLGHFRSAEHAYREAVQLAPFSPWYAHNLGHLMDVALDRPKDALRYLLAAHRSLPHEPEIAGSLAHALARANRWHEAVPILSKALGKDEAAAEAMLRDWLTRNPPGSLPDASHADDLALLNAQVLQEPTLPDEPPGAERTRTVDERPGSVDETPHAQDDAASVD
jgi:Flp pilus assembly protein TadD